MGLRCSPSAQVIGTTVKTLLKVSAAGVESLRAKE